MKFKITREWLSSKLAQMDAAGVDEIADCGVPGSVMVCKLQLHSLQPSGTLCASDNSPMPASKMRFGGVWEGSTEKQQMSENAIFGHWTPCAEFTAMVKNENVIDRLQVGKKYYVNFTEAPD